MDEEPETTAPKLRRGATGTPAEIDGETWIFCGHVPALEPLWDRLYDGNVFYGRYDEFDVYSGAIRLLSANYDIEPDEAARLVLSADPKDLVHAVEIALFGDGDDYRSYGDYVRLSLWSNAIDPAVLPPEMVRPVMQALVETGRALPPSKGVSSAAAAAKRQGLAALVRPKPPEPQPLPEPQTPEPE